MTAEAIREAEVRYQRARAVAEHARVERNAAVRSGLAAGMTHRQVAAALGKSRGRVAQIATSDGRDAWAQRA
jgi:hypothetical protein